MLASNILTRNNKFDKWAQCKAVCKIAVVQSLKLHDILCPVNIGL